MTAEAVARAHPEREFAVTPARKGDGKQRLLTVTQRKGGAGKTMLARLTAEYQAGVRQRRVLLVDLDNQCNASQVFLDMEGRNANEGYRPPHNPDWDPQVHGNECKRSSSADIFYGAVFLPFRVQRPGLETLDILPAHTQLLKEVEYQEKTKLADPVRAQIQKVFSNRDIRQAYDLVIFDTGPRGGLLDEAAMRASTHVLIPVEPEEHCLSGLALMCGMWRTENLTREKGHELDLVGLQINKYQNTQEHNDNIAELRQHPEFGPLLCPTMIPRRIAFAASDKASAKPKSVFQLGRSNDVRQVAEEFAAYVDEKLFGDAP